jgi:hypothetical protein
VLTRRGGPGSTHRSRSHPFRRHVCDERPSTDDGYGVRLACHWVCAGGHPAPFMDRPFPAVNAARPPGVSGQFCSILLSCGRRAAARAGRLVEFPGCIAVCFETCMACSMAGSDRTAVGDQKHFAVFPRRLFNAQSRRGRIVAWNLARAAQP